MSTISLTAYVLSLVCAFVSFGTWNYILQCMMIVILAILLKTIKGGYVISFFLAILYGKLIDFFNRFIQQLPNSLPLNLLYYTIAFWGMALGTCLLFKCRVPVLPFDTFTRDISNHFSISYKKIRTCFDLFCLVFSAVLDFYFVHAFKGIGIGTVINAVFLGMSVSLISDLFDKKFYFQPIVKWLGRLS